MLENTILNNADKLKALVKEGPDAIMNSTDPFIYFLVNTEAQRTKLQPRKCR